MMIEIVEEGPDTKWLQSKALGRFYRLHAIKGTDKYRLDMFGKGNTRIFTDERSFDTVDEARTWARTEFIMYLDQEKLLPGLGALLE